jgi:hypothetical protein
MWRALGQRPASLWHHAESFQSVFEIPLAAEGSGDTSALPVDRIVLAEAGIDAAWTKSDSEDEYLGWINRLKIAAKTLGLAE